MKFAIAAIVLFALIPPPPYPPLDPGVSTIGWENGIGADTVIVRLNRPDCPIAARGAPGDTGDPQQAITQVPQGPPFDPACLLRPGDRVVLERWKDGQKIDEIGPYIVPVRIFVPMVNR